VPAWLLTLSHRQSGLFPGCVYIFSRWYTRQERVARVSLCVDTAQQLPRAG
jgi:hypothetical protein